MRHGQGATAPHHQDNTGSRSRDGRAEVSQVHDGLMRAEVASSLLEHKCSSKLGPRSMSGHGA